MVIEASLERFDPFGGGTQSGYRQQERAGDDAYTPDFSSHRVTVHTGHLDIKHHHIRTLGVVRGERAYTGHSRLNDVTVSLEEQYVGIDQIWVVVRDE